MLHRRDDIYRDIGHARYLAEHIPGAKLVELQGIDHLPYLGDADSILDEVEEFLTGVRPPPERDRVLATVMFTDIVGSTQHASPDRRPGLEAAPRAAPRAGAGELSRYRGREVDTAGDGFLATFDGPARAMRCATRDRGGDAGDRPRGPRRGPHRRGRAEGTNVRGIAVHIGARVAPSLDRARCSSQRRSARSSLGPASSLPTAARCP